MIKYIRVRREESEASNNIVSSYIIKLASLSVCLSIRNRLPIHEYYGDENFTGNSMDLQSWTKILSQETLLTSFKMDIVAEFVILILDLFTSVSIVW